MLFCSTDGQQDIKMSRAEQKKILLVYTITVELATMLAVLHTFLRDSFNAKCSDVKIKWSPVVSGALDVSGLDDTLSDNDRTTTNEGNL